MNQQVNPPPNSPLDIARRRAREQGQAGAATLPEPPSDSPLAEARRRAQQQQQQQQQPQDMPTASNGPLLPENPQPARSPSRNRPDNVTADNNDESLLDRSKRRAVQEIAATPGVFSGLYGLAAAAVDRALFEDDWESSFLSEDGKAMIEAARAGDPQARAAIQADPTTLLRSGLANAARWYEWGGELGGVTNNKDGSVPLDEEIGGIALSTLITLPAAIATRPAAAINKITNRAARSAARVALRSAELATPLTIGAGPYGSNIAANAGVQIALNDVMRAATDQTTAYETLGQSIGVGIDPGMPQDTDEIAGAADPLDDGNSALLPALGIAAGALAGGAGLQRLARGMSLDETAPDNGRIIADMTETPRLAPLAPRNRNPAQTVGDLSRRLNESMTDDQGILVRAVEATAGREKSVKFNDFLRSQSGGSMRVNQERYMRTGILDEGIKTTPPVQFAQNFRNSTPKVQRNTNAVLEALGELARRDRIDEKQSNLPNTDAELRRRVTQMLQNADVNRLVGQYREIMDGFSEYRYKNGIISADQRQIERARGYYVPAISKQDMGTPFSRFMNRTFSMSPQQSDRNRFEMQLDAGKMEELASPMDVLPTYISRQMEYVAEQRVRKSFLDYVANKTQRDRKDRRVLVTTSAPKRGRGEKMEVLVNGDKDNPKVFYVGDRRIANALRNQPKMTIPIARDMRALYQRGTTGNLNPLFAPISLAYDAMFGMLGGDARRMYTGIFDRKLSQLGFSPEMRNLLGGLTRPIDTLMLIGEGLNQGMMGRLQRVTAERMMRQAHLNGTRVTEAQAEAAADVFIKSKYGLMHMNGYASNSLIDNQIELSTGLGSKFTDAMQKTGLPQSSRFAVGLLDAIRDAYRMGVFSRNYSYAQIDHAKAMRTKYKARGERPPKAAMEVPPEMVRRIVRHTKEVSVDPTRRGSSDFVNAITSATPYGNIMMLSTAHLVRNMVANPGARATGLTLGGLAAWQYMNMSPEAREYTEERVPDYRQISHLAIEVPRAEGEAFDPDKHMYHFPLGPELGTIVNMMKHTVAGMVEEETRTNSLDPTLGDKLSTALGDLLSLPVPPALNVPANAAGFGQMQPGAALDNRELFRQPQIAGASEEFRGIGQDGGMLSDRVANMLNSALGTVGRTIADAAEIMDQSYEMDDVSFNEGMEQALDVVKFNMVDNQQVGTLFTNATRLKPRGTPVSEQAYEIDNQLERATDIARTLIPKFSEGLYDSDIPYDRVLTMLPQELEDPSLIRQATWVENYFLQSPHNREAMRNISQLNKQYFQTGSNVMDNQDEVRKVQNEINDKRFDNFAIVIDGYTQFEEQMRAEFGEDWSLERFISAAEKDLQ